MDKRPETAALAQKRQFEAAIADHGLTPIEAETIKIAVHAQDPHRLTTGAINSIVRQAAVLKAKAGKIDPTTVAKLVRLNLSRDTSSDNARLSAFYRAQNRGRKE